MYSYVLHTKVVNFDPSYRREFGILCVYKVGRDPPTPLNLTLSIMDWEGVRIVARTLNKEYLVNKLHILFMNIIFFENHHNKIIIENSYYTNTIESTLVYDTQISKYP